MAAILGRAWEAYNFLFEELPDRRMRHLLLVAKPYQVLAVLGIYLTFVFKWGPRYMKGRPAYNLDKLLIAYNFFQVITCVYIFYRAIILAWGWNYKWFCEPVDFSNNQNAVDIAMTTYLYYLMKVIDLLDTVFFILRKKARQVSFLHIYHHTGMVLLIWGATTYLPGGHGTLIGVINSFVHIVMYSYYLYTVINPAAKQSLWWKKYITQLQIVQFFWCVVHMLVIVFKPDCAYPRWVSAVFLPQNCFILVLFIDFYIKTYIRKPEVKQTEDLKKSKQSNGHTGNENGYKTDNKKHQNGKHLKPNGNHNYQNGSNVNNDTSTQNRTLASSQNETHDTKNGTSSRNNLRIPENDFKNRIGTCLQNSVLNTDGKHKKFE